MNLSPRTARGEAKPRPKILRIRDLTSLPAPRWLIRKFLPEGLLVLWGDNSAGKSFLALMCAVCIAAGIPWFGRKVRQGPVVYIYAEGTGGLTAKFRPAFAFSTDATTRLAPILIISSSERLPTTTAT